MKFLDLVSASIVALGLTATTSSGASLLGDDIDIVGLFPTLDRVNGARTVTVASGDDDRFTFGGGVFAHADALQLNFIIPNATTFATGADVPNGGNFISFEDLDFNDGSVLSAVSLSSTFGGLTLADIIFGDDFVRFNVSGISPFSGDSLVIDLETSSSTAIPAVPLPAGSLLLLTGLAGIAGLKRRKKT